MRHVADLAFILGARKPQEAEAMYRETLAMMKRQLKPSHPMMITVTKNFAQFYVNQKNLAQAEVLLRELLALQRNVLGNENRQIANTLATLAATLIDNGKPAEGEKIARESLALHRKLYGEESLEVSTAMHDLGIALSRLKKFDEGEALLREALATERKLLPPDSTRLGTAIYNLAYFLDDADKLAEAETFFRERLDRAHAKPDPEPMDLENRIYDLAHNVYAQKKYAQAETLYRELIQRRSSRLPATNEGVIEPKASLGRLLADWAWAERSNTAAATRTLERAKEGERMLRECLTVRLQGTNTVHWRVSDLRSRLGGAMLSVAVTDRALTEEARQARFAEIETLLLEGHKGIMPRNSPGRTRKRGALERLVRLYETWNKPAQAADWREKLAAFDKSKAADESSPPSDAEAAP